MVIVAALVLLGVFFLIPSAFSETILLEGFESGTTGWVGPISGVSSPTRTGSFAAKLTVGSTGLKGTYRVVTVAAGASHSLQGYVLKNDPGIESASLKIYWYSSTDGAGEAISWVSSTSQTVDQPSFQSLAVSTAVAPGGAQSARVGLWVTTSPSLAGTASVYLDDVSFVRVDATATPTPTPTGTPTFTPTLTPTPTPTSPPTLTPTPSPTPTATATSAGASPDTPSPVATSTFTSTPTSTATATPSPTPVGELLQNGGFESGNAGAPTSWNAYGGSLAQSASLRRSGGYSGALTSNGATAKWIYQTVPVSANATYLLEGYASNPNGAAVEVRLRVSFYASADGTGEELVHSDALGSSTAEWAELTVSAKAPAASASARIKAMLMPASEAAAIVYFDDLSLIKTADAPPPLPAPLPAPPAVPTRTPVPRPTPTFTPTPVPERIVNHNLEEAKNGIPDGWETFGGKLIQVGSPVRSGMGAAAFISTTASTKWAYQTVSVSPGQYYVFSGYIYNDDPNVDATYLRLSWYASSDGAGTQISYNDSLTALELAGKSQGYRLLTTGAVRAPANARSAKTRIMLDPVSSNYAIIYFDDISFNRAEITPTPTPSPTAPATPTLTPSPTPTVAPSPTSSAVPTPLATPMPTGTPLHRPTVVAPRNTPSPTPPAPSPVAWSPSTPTLITPGPAADLTNAVPNDPGPTPLSKPVGGLPKTGDYLPYDFALAGVACLFLGLLIWRRGGAWGRGTG
ncbi:MAG: hypothetical protein HYX92_22505, partial [Chloroflexi bacterium]|nr:hypothetical protein [Chloroflexota bacterium]